MLGLHFAMTISQFHYQICLPIEWGIIFLVAAKTITVLHVLIAVNDGGSPMIGASIAQHVIRLENKIWEVFSFSTEPLYRLILRSRIPVRPLPFKEQPPC